MSSSPITIKASGLGKAYRIYRKPEDRLKQFFFGRWKRYFEEYWALNDLSIEIRRGEAVGIIGLNGSGKSTFLQLVCGTLTPTTGQIVVDGRVAALLELGAGFNPEFTGRENVYLAASVLGLSSSKIEERFQAILEFASIGDFIDQPVKLYSSGMYARLAFAVVAHVDADILIIDEILAVGDAAFTQKCMAFVRKFRSQGTLLFVSHDTGSVVSLCDRAIWLDSGFVREQGPAKDVCHSYLASIAQGKDNVNSFKIGGSRKAPPESSLQTYDVRRSDLRTSQHRNEIEIFNFDPDAPWFGHRGASIVSIIMQNADQSIPAVLEGGEEVILKIEGVAHQELAQPIIGFFIKDKRGQHLFGDNTYLTYSEHSVTVRKDHRFQATFRFIMPYLPTGDYSILAAIAEGTQQEHLHHHWIDDALFFRVHSSHLARGLIGVPMVEIGLEALDEVRSWESASRCDPAAASSK